MPYISSLRPKLFHSVKVSATSTGNLLKIVHALDLLLNNINFEVWPSLVITWTMCISWLILHNN